MMFRRLRIRRIAAVGFGVFVLTYILVSCFWTTVLEYPTTDSLKMFLKSVTGKNLGSKNLKPNLAWTRFENLDNPFKKETNCLERSNFVFIKPMKCATETMGTILRRFGYVRHLNFVLPVGENLYLGWPYIMEPQDYRPSHRPFNAIMEHSIYNSTVMGAIMPQDTAYITIIREPWKHFKSTFSYFNVRNIAEVAGSDPVTEYLHDLGRYERIYKSGDASLYRYCIPDNFSITKNIQTHCLGMPLGFPPGRRNITLDDEAVTKYITELDSQFTLVMIMEYFHESLVLLKRLMCWSMKDILYYKANAGNYTYIRPSSDSEANKAIHRHWSHIDYLLYDHFNQTFWRKVYNEGSGFFNEVAQFKRAQMVTNRFCHRFVNSTSHESFFSLTIPQSQFNEEFDIDIEYCRLMRSELLKDLKARFDKEEKWPKKSKSTPKTKRGC